MNTKKESRTENKNRKIDFAGFIQTNPYQTNSYQADSYQADPYQTNQLLQDQVAETPEKYTVPESLLTPYYKRKDLTSAEKVEIGNYQDIHPWNKQKQDWSFPIPEDWKNKTHCYANNSCCRFDNF